MTDLSWFSTEELAGIASSITELGPDEGDPGAPSAVFRDVDGAYWRAGASGWAVHSEGGWRRADAPPALLEGPAALAALAPGLKRPARAEAPERRSDDVLAFLRDTATDVSEAYVRGEISSEDAESLLAGHVVCDAGGVVWLPGCRSGRWYGFRDGSWSPADGPPDAGSFVEPGRGPRTCGSCGRESAEGRFCPSCGTELPEEAPLVWPERAGEAIAAFVEADTPLPEPVADPWDPPPPAAEEAAPSEPAPGQTCPRCGEPAAEGDAFCPNCGSALAGMPAACPACGTPAEADDAFCANCGTRLAAAPAEAAAAEASVPDLPAWAPTHVVPASGMSAWPAPDPTAAVVANLAPGLPLELVERRGDWGHVVASNGWTGWVDARLLEVR